MPRGVMSWRVKRCICVRTCASKRRRNRFARDTWRRGRVNPPAPSSTGSRSSNATGTVLTYSMKPDFVFGAESAVSPAKYTVRASDQFICRLG